jgi:hypothetical protein
MTLQDRAVVVGQYPTQGLGGSVEVFLMPEDEVFQFTTGRAVDGNGEIHIEGIGVAPTIDVPVDEETLFSEGDPVLDEAIGYLDEATALEIVDAGALAIGDTVTGTLSPRTRVQYALDVSAGDSISVFLSDDAGELDTYLRIYDAQQTLIAENDDREAGVVVNSAIEDLVVPEDMTLVIEAGTFEDSGEGMFTLEVAPAGATAPPAETSASADTTTAPDAPATTAA